MSIKEEDWKPLTFDEACKRVRQTRITKEMTYEERLKMLKGGMDYDTRRTNKSCGKENNRTIHGYSTAEDAFIAGAKWADANPCMPDKVVKIPVYTEEEIREMLEKDLYRAYYNSLFLGCEISPSPWISVDERLPDDGVLVIVAFRCVAGEILYSTDTFLIDYGWEGYDEVVAWMPIPELPKEEKK